ncbi:MAG: M28 family peptidase [candidate division Zixibacteria bacterium]|nr:M28 family peptidase [candidate division Zixibacteria bacterium]
MKLSLIVALVLAITACTPTASGEAKYEITTDSIYNHIAVLAHDSLEGRRVGYEGEIKAAKYIYNIMSTAGLEPKGDSSTFLQSFIFTKKIEYGEANSLTLNGEQLELKSEFLPMRQSASIVFDFTGIVDVGYGITVDSSEGDYDDYAGVDTEGKAVIVRRFAPETTDSTQPDLDRYSSLTNKISNALDHKAAAVFFVTPPDHDDTLRGGGPVRVSPKEIPIVFLRRAGLERLGLDIDSPDISSLTGEVDIYKIRDTGYNVVGYIPTANDTTVIFGAHYDHLGWGGPGSGSRYLGEEPMIHNGADDNGSGTAALLELARYFADRKREIKYSMLFIAFSGEEFGVLGSSHYARHMTIDSSKVRMMINMDMIGRLAEQDKGLAIMGTGTCPEFKIYLDSLDVTDLKLALKESGMGPSDHASFYNRGIPVLNFFTGAHEDYHKPEDDIEKLDCDGIVRVASLVADITSHFDRFDGPLTFQKTKTPEGMSARSNFSVTLGIMPDFISEVNGLGVDGVSPDRPGERAGLIEGDVIIKMGDIKIGDIYDYMNALGKFRKGDTTSVAVVRLLDTLQMEVIFE